MHDKAGKCVNLMKNKFHKGLTKISSTLWAACIQAHGRPWLCSNVPRRGLGLTLKDFCTEENALGSHPLYSHPESGHEATVPAHRHCSSQMDPGYQSVAHCNPALLYPGCTAAEERVWKQFTADLHVESQKPEGTTDACQACSHCCRQSQWQTAAAAVPDLQQFTREEN